MNNKLLLGGGIVVIVAIVLVSGFLNQATNQPAGIQAERDRQLSLQNTSQDSSQAEQIAKNLDNIAQVEGQKITEVTDKTIKLSNGEIINFSDSKNIGCKVGDVISDYNDSNQSLVCVRTDPNTGQKSNFFANVGSGIVGGLIGNYIASKLFNRNNGVSFDPNTNGYRTPNGDVYTQNQTNNQSVTTSTTNNQNRNRITNRFGRSTTGSNSNSNNGGFLGGLFGGGSVSNNGTNGDSGTSGGKKNGTHVGSGGVSGSKGGGNTSGGG
jgi:hypothetical protein